MRLKSLELQGFKTFPDKTLLSFDTGITAVVGPNGSGKSNISDAIRWVLGEQSIKTIRCVKMEDVIFNGTQNRNAKGFASATLTILNTDRKLPIESDEVSITRRYYRSGESEYIINNKEVRLKDIHGILMDTGLGRDGYSIISQGKIDAIISSKNEDRREIFEEAAGISRYRYRKEEAKKQLLLAEDNLIRLNDIICELKERLGPLEQQAKKAKDYIELAGRKKEIEIGLWLSILNNSMDSLNNQDSKLKILDGHYKEIEESLKLFNSNMETFSEKMLLNNVKIDECRKRLAYCEENAIVKSGEISVKKNDILHNNENLKRIDSEISKAGEFFNNIQNDILLKENRLESLNNNKEDMQKCLQGFINEFNEFINNIDNYSKESNKISNEILEINKNTSIKRLEVASSQATVDELNGRLGSIEENIKIYNNRLDDLTSLLLYNKNRCYDLKNISDEKFNKVQEYEKLLHENNKKNEYLKSEADNLTLDSESIVRKVRLLEELERNMDGFTQSVKFILKEKKKGSLSGICGVVSRIIRLDDLYSTAIEIALGAAMQNIIVETDQDAKNAIKLLKAKNAGRATFLPISSIRPSRLKEAGIEKYTGFIGIASDICRCEDKYRNVLDYLLGRVVIVDNLDNAINIAKAFLYRFRIVTLDGQVINSGGSLTGGSLMKSARLLNRANEIETLKAKFNDISNKAKNARLLFNESEKKSMSIKEKLKSSSLELEKSKEEYELVRDELKSQNLEEVSLKEHVDRLYSEQSVIKSRIQSLNNNVKKSNDELFTLEEKLKFLESKLNEIYTDRDGLAEKKENISYKIHKTEYDILSIEKDINLCNNEIKSLIEQRESEENKVNLLKSEYESIGIKNLELEKNIDCLEVEISALKHESVELDKSITNLMTEKMEFERNITEIRNSEVDKISEREKLALEIARLQDKRDDIQKEYDTIISKLWDEYELTKREAALQFKPSIDLRSSNRALNEIKLRIKNLGNVNVGAVEEYEQVLERFQFMNVQIEDVEKSKKELYKLVSDLTNQMKSLFISRFKQINENFNQVFKELFLGGKASLSLTEPDNVLNSGIEIYVQPPGKIVTHLEALSGGECALIAIALYFAILKVSPSPFCVLDEIEAALDEVNVSRFASYLRKMNKNTQFIVISHRRGTMEEADMLYGVTMQDEGISKLLELKVSEIEQNFIKE